MFLFISSNVLYFYTQLSFKSIPLGGSLCFNLFYYLNPAAIQCHLWPNFILFNTLNRICLIMTLCTPTLFYSVFSRASSGGQAGWRQGSGQGEQPSAHPSLHGADRFTHGESLRHVRTLIRRSRFFNTCDSHIPYSMTTKNVRLCYKWFQDDRSKWGKLSETGLQYC